MLKVKRWQSNHLRECFTIKLFLIRRSEGEAELDEDCYCGWLGWCPSSIELWLFDWFQSKYWELSLHQMIHHHKIVIRSVIWCQDYGRRIIIMNLNCSLYFISEITESWPSVIWWLDDCLHLVHMNVGWKMYCNCTVSIYFYVFISSTNSESLFLTFGLEVMVIKTLINQRQQGYFWLWIM